MFVFCLLAMSAQALAQRCDIDYELILNLRNPEVGSYSVWDTVWGEQLQDEHFKSALVLDNSEVLAAGLRVGEIVGQNQLVLAQVRKNGRVRWRQVHDVKGLTEVVKIVKGPGGFWVLANRDVAKDRSGVWMGVFDAQGALLKTHQINDKKDALAGHDVLYVDDKSWKKAPFLLAASRAENVGTENAVSSTVFYRLNSKGRVVSDKVIVTGQDNRIWGLELLEDSQVLATGYAYGTDGRKMGWIVRLDEKTDVRWQQHYPRGAGAQLIQGRGLRDDAFVVVGTAAPAVKDGKRAGWVMAVQRDNGRVIWQRYFSGELEFLGRDVLVSKDGLLSVLIDGEAPKKSEVMPHVRVLTINPRGVLMFSDAFFQGEGVDAYQLVPGPNRERVIVGGANMVYQIEALDTPEGDNKPDVEIRRSKDGWLSAAVPAQPYEDPCLPKPFVQP